ncbi:hypothetical protein HBI25_120060 [Parastagonospora nodorum]|nr:hypothetical protein HBI25_120060 [Parastagonospora nodorum]
MGMELRIAGEILIWVKYIVLRREEWSAIYSGLIDLGRRSVESQNVWNFTRCRFDSPGFAQLHDECWKTGSRSGLASESNNHNIPGVLYQA